MPATVRLTEWSTTIGLQLTTAQRDALRGQLSVTVQPAVGAADRYDVTPGNTIGALTVDHTNFLIQPKIPINRVLFLLGYLADPTAWADDDAVLGDAPSLVDAIAALFVRVAERSLERGLLAGYYEVEDTLTTVRGRIDLAEQLRRSPGQSSPLALRYNEYDHDIEENRLLLATVLLLRRLPLRVAPTRQALRRLADGLQDVTPTNYPPSRIPHITWTRLNLHYRPAVELARLLLRHQSPELTTGAHPVAALTIDMAGVFEEFIRTALREAAHLDTSSFPDGEHCPALRLDTGGRVRLKPDLSRWKGAQCSFVGDVKYKRDAGAGSNNDLYQLHAYATATHLADATLIYAYGPPEPATHHVANTDIRLHVRHVDLALTPTALLGAIAQLADSLLTPHAATTGTGTVSA